MLTLSAATYPADLEFVKAILRKWDPIGVVEDDDGARRDEYDSYAPRVLSLLVGRASAADIAAHLGMIRTSSIGLNAEPKSDRRIAEELVGFRDAGPTFETAGYRLFTKALDDDACERLISALPVTQVRRAGARNLLSFGVVSSLVTSSPIQSIIGEVMHEPSIYAVKASLFEKSARGNWAVPWHQDQIVALDARVPSSEFRGWTIKSGVVHGNAPTRVLERMVALRIHLDECSEADGALQVVPGTHRLGKLKAAEIRKVTSIYRGSTLCAGRGTILAMNPLLLHRSSISSGSSRRRVLHIEFASPGAASPARWSNPVRARRGLTLV